MEGGLMPRGLNRVMLIGNVGADPETRFTPSGLQVTSFRMAVNRRWTTREGEEREATEWFSVKAWRRLADICQQYVSKGRQVYVEGRLESSSWEDSEGQQRHRVEVVAREVILLGRSEAVAVPRREDDIDVDEIPF
jgi:single-strand DNA-binding protein